MNRQEVMRKSSFKSIMKLPSILSCSLRYDSQKKKIHEISFETRRVPTVEKD